MIKIDENILQATINQAQKSDRKRKNFNFHKSADDTFQRMLNAVEPFSYCQPHKHENPDKDEVFVILKGKLLIVEFDDFGNITETFILAKENNNYAVEIPARKYHTIISLEEGTVVFEFKHGPYNPQNDKIFATWAPPENDKNAQIYLNNLLKKLII